MLLLTYLLLLFLKSFFCTQSCWMWKFFKEIDLTHWWDPNWYYHSGSNGSEGYSKLPRSPQLEPPHQMQFNVILRIPFFKAYKSAYPKLRWQGGNEVVKLATIVRGDQKAPFSIATTLRCRGGCYFFPWIAPLYPWYVPYIVEC